MGMDATKKYETVELSGRLLKHLPRLPATHAVILSRIVPAEVMEIVHRLEELDTPAAS
jgi:hypothetical protein